MMPDFISKIIERIVKSRQTDHLSSNNLFNPQQYACCKQHSWSSHQCYRVTKISRLCLIDCSVAFNTIDHNILITHLHLGLGFMALFSTGLSLTYHLTLSMLNVINASLTSIPILW